MAEDAEWKSMDNPQQEVLYWDGKTPILVPTENDWYKIHVHSEDVTKEELSEENAKQLINQMIGFKTD
jgi:hypothetical protein